MVKRKATSKRKINITILILILLVALIIRLIFFQGVGASDSLRHTKYAYDISNGIFPTDNNQGNFRIALLIPVSFLYSIFGANEFSSNVLILVMSLSGIVLIYLFGKLLFNENVGLVAAFLLSIFPLDIVYSTTFMSDLPSAVFSGLSIYLFLRAEKIEKSSKSIILYALSGISLGISFSVREMAIVTFLFYLCYVFYNKKLKISYGIVAVGFLSIFVLELFFFNAYTGNPFYRFTSLSGHYVDRLEFHNFYGRSSLLKFFSTWPYVIFGNLEQGIFFTLISMAVIYWILNRKNEVDYLLMWFLSIALYFYFGSTSITSYQPILAVARYLCYVTIPGLLLLSAFLMKAKKFNNRIILPLILIFLFISTIWALNLDQSRHILDNLRETYSYMKSFDKPIYTDYRSIWALQYISGFNNSLSLVDLDLNPKNIKNINDSYIIINNQFIRNLIAAQAKLVFPNEIKEIPSNWVKVKVIGNSNDNLIIYYAKPQE